MNDTEQRLALLDEAALLIPLEGLRDCHFCPRNCHADRFSGKLGYCKSGAAFNISSICIHRGEEPVISGPKGICNIFFTHCNLQCVYCQNYQISCNRTPQDGNAQSLKQVLRQIIRILETGINIVGFVSPSHFIPQVKIIIMALRSMGYDPAFVFNTNGYDRPETIRSLEPMIDVYLPDFKYSDPRLAFKLSDARDYPELVLASLKEMVSQKGTRLITGRNGYARRGVIIRHLVLPGYPGNSIGVLRTLAGEVSNELHISLMSQYYPAHQAIHDEFLGKKIEPSEYRLVVEELHRLGFHQGWVQELESRENYRPDFMREHPFES